MAKGWGNRAKKRRSVSGGLGAASAAGADGAADADPAAIAAEQVAEAPVAGKGQGILRRIARALWRTDYSVLFEEEHLLNEAACGPNFQLEPSTYRKRLTGERAEVYDVKMRRRGRDELAIRLHANNQQHWSPSLLARSVSYFNVATNFLASTELQQRRLASRPTTFSFLQLMVAEQPAPSYPRRARLNISCCTNICSTRSACRHAISAHKSCKEHAFPQERASRALWL